MAISMTRAEDRGADLPGAERARQVLAGFRGGLYRCLTRRGDELSGLGDAMLCADGPVQDLARLSLVAGHRRGHGAVYDALNAGRVDIGRLRWALAGLPLPAWPDGRIRLAVDVSPWLRPEAATSPGRLFCHVYGRGKGSAQMIPGWPYSVIAALEPGRASWTAVLDAVRLRPDDDETEVTAAQVRDVITRLAEAGHWRDGDPAILVVFDAGYDVTRLAWLLADLPVELPGRLRADRVMRLPAPPRRPGTNGRPRKHGGELALADPATWPAPQVTTSTVTSRYGMAAAAAWDRVHPRLTHRAAWLDHDGDLPVIEGTLIRLQVDRLPGDRDPKPVWLWWSRTGAAPAEVDRCWQSFLRRFDLEHTFRLFKQVLGWTAPKIRSPAGRGPVDLADHRLLRPAPPRPAPRRRPAAALAAALPARTAHARPGPPGLPEHPPDSRLPGQCAETRQARPRPPARLEEPPPRNPPRRGKNNQKRPHAQGRARTDGLNNKLGRV